MKKIFAIALSLVICRQSEDQEQFNFMGSFDQNGDQKVTQQQFLSYLGKLQTLTEHDQDRQWQQTGKIAFKVYDLDSNGWFDVDQFNKFQKQMHALYDHNIEDNEQAL